MPAMTKYLALMDEVIKHSHEPTALDTWHRLNALWWAMTDEQRTIVDRRFISHIPKGPMPNPREESFVRESYPDITMITPNIFVGAHPPMGLLDQVHDYAGIGVIVSVAKECPVHAAHHPNRVVFHAPLQDAGAPTEHEYRIANVAARFVAAEVAKGQQVLVCCFAGINRSAWVAAWAMKLAGTDPEDAITLLRHARGKHLLSNQYFEALIRSDKH